MKKMFVQPPIQGLSHSRLLSKYLVTLLPATFKLCSWKRKDQLKLISLKLNKFHRVHIGFIL